MCEIEKKLKLCTCLTDKDLDLFEARKKLKQSLKQSISTSNQPFTWTLFKYLGQKDNEELTIMGMLIMPSDLLGESLTNEYVLSQINSGNCFDFDYTPMEGDNLKVEQQSNESWKEFLSFIFRNGTWKEGIYNTFTERIEAVNFGQVKIE